MVQWTDRQLEAIEYEGSDVLVAAAAGSGKTTVLVERIIRRVLDGRYGIDGVFVATFTNMSARDMKDKIEKALRGAYQEKRDPNIYNEMLKLKEAHISTLHSFCLHLIQMHYNTIGLSPDMRTLGDVEMKIRLDQVISNVLEAYYSKGEPDFNTLAMMLSTDKSNDGLLNTVRDLYYTAVASPDPRGYLERNIDQYHNTGHLQSILDAHDHNIRLKLDALMNDVDLLRHHYNTVTHSTIKDAQVRDAFDALEALARKVMQSIEANRNGELAELPPFALKDGRTAFIKNIEDPDEKAQLLALQNRVKKRYTGIKDARAYTLERVADEMAPMNGPSNVLIRIVADVIDRFQNQKLSRNEMDFSDYEHYALAILNAQDGAVRKLYQSRFKEVMIDEYQDINRVQEAIIQSLKTGDETSGNLFMVGDVKQSIYKFRQADPSLFIEKSERFGAPDSGKLISLNHNFRSRGEVIDLTNAVFERIMDREVGEVEYDETHRLVQGNHLDAPPLPSEVHIIEDAESRGDDAEIVHIAQVVKQLKKKGADYNDIVILTRNTRDNEAYRKLLSEAELPVFVNNRSGYLDTLEIRTMISILSIVDNPLQDDHLVGTMRLPMFNFTENDIAHIRAVSDCDYMYEALVQYEGPALVMKKIDEFMDAHRTLQSYARYMSVPELIDEIYVELNIVEYFAGLKGGLTRRANLNGFIEKAMEFEKMSHLSLYEFIAYIHRMIEDGQDFGEENTVSDDADTLRVMTIHASKGLEFSYVIYAGLYRQLNMMDLMKKVTIHPDAGIAFKRFMPDNQVILPSIHQQVVRQMIQQERISEEMRLVYVAMTRAIDQLIIPLVYKAGMTEKFTYEGGKVHADDRLSIRSIQDLLSPVLVNTPMEALRIHHIEEVEAAPQAIRHTSLDDIEAMKIGGNQLLKERILYRYPHTQATETVYKESVTEIKRRNETPPDDSAIIRYDRTPNFRAPNFRNDTLDAPVFGTMMHQMMMHLLNRYDDLRKLAGEARDAFIEQMILENTSDDPLITPEHQAQMIRNIHHFLSDDTMCGLLEQQRSIHTEIPFIMNQKAIGYSDFDLQMVQGIVDALLEMEDDFVIIDYKTDRVHQTGLTEADLIGRYSTQMDIYRRSLMQALQKDVTVYLYFFDYGAIRFDK
ncbi:helicase-exonuclease AddAB subunit AddA [Salinicoccus cyprini]|uniref:DNA 3'-5' helicase n=1 Tax=Salinicoccus cyprini TaxID=2493691 RepID=A0A558AWZ8_9STAP|nr:helicase-exonuclease AddAB subunit AddA [Salinicoccus cyprini]TVT28771.1 helicase-exonuclease AddAB subunit AddA [Salinicoccus cyprini]